VSGDPHLQKERSAFLDACRRQPVPHRPIWIMRQAGRYLPEYRALRAKVDFETLTRTPELAAEVTLQPLRRFALDAAILFSDIMTPLQGMGVPLVFEPAPVVREPIRTMAQIEALPALLPERDVPFVLESIRLVRAGAPRRLLSCVISSPAVPPRSSRQRVRSCMRSRRRPSACSRGSPRPWRSIFRRRRAPARRR
jgi:uroporphyrinogen-III decarboxylase